MMSRGTVEGRCGLLTFLSASAFVWPQVNGSTTHHAKWAFSYEAEKGGAAEVRRTVEGTHNRSTRNRSAHDPSARLTHGNRGHAIEGTRWEDARGLRGRAHVVASAILPPHPPFPIPACSHCTSVRLLGHRCCTCTWSPARARPTGCTCARGGCREARPPSTPTTSSFCRAATPRRARRRARARPLRALTCSSTSGTKARSTSAASLRCRGARCGAWGWTTRAAATRSSTWASAAIALRCTCTSSSDSS